MLRSRPGRLCGLDIGTQKTGVALSDSSLLFVSPLCTVNTSSLATELKKHLKKIDITGFIIGLPLDEDGEETRRAKQFISILEKTNYDFKAIYFQDERFSTASVRHAMSVREIGYKVNRSNNKRATMFAEEKDSLAAAVILQQFIDKLNSGSK